jgi:hypothetical protein
MIVRTVRWEGTDVSWQAVVDLYDGLELVTFRNDDNTLEVGTWDGQVQVPIGQWVVRRNDAIEVWSSAPPLS